MEDQASLAWFVLRQNPRIYNLSGEPKTSPVVKYIDSDGRTPGFASRVKKAEPNFSRSWLVSCVLSCLVHSVKVRCALARVSRRLAIPRESLKAVSFSSVRRYSWFLRSFRSLFTGVAEMSSTFVFTPDSIIEQSSQVAILTL
jgi:hypothetical protein